MKYLYKLSLFFLLLFYVSFLFAQRNQTYLNYIEQYKDCAIQQMFRYRIPASITLAQGLLESAAGQSKLCKKGNNHFGIKVTTEWKGPYMLQDDDYKNEKFRVYKSAYESYEDHSLFLANRSRYAFLFNLKPIDYVGWAHGLKKAGYATNPRYGHLLVDLIKNYDLARFDYAVPGQRRHDKTEQITAQTFSHKVYFNNDNYYVIAKYGDTFQSIGKEMGVSYRKLRRYNEVDKHYVLQAGDIVYMEKKERKADKIYKGRYHTVGVGESMYSIAQKYGVRLKTLYKINDLEKDFQPQVGFQLRIR